MEPERSVVVGGSSAKVSQSFPSVRPARRHSRPRRRAVRRRAVGDDAARRPRRRGDQGRGPLRRRRRRPLRAAVPGGRGLALLRDVQPEQAEHLARPAPSRGIARVFEDLVRVGATPSSRTCAATSRRSCGSATPTSSTSTRASSAARSRASATTGPRARRGRVRLHAPGARGLAERDRRPGRAADEERALARRLLRRLRRRARDPRRRLARAARRPRRRHRPLAVRGGARAAHLHRHLGRLARLRARAARELGAPVDGAVPELRDAPTAGSSSPARSRRCGCGSARRSARARARHRRALRVVRATATATAPSSSPMLEPIFRRADHGRVARGAARPRASRARR